MHGVLLISVAAYRKARAIIGTLNGGAPPLFHIGPFYLFIWGGGLNAFKEVLTWINQKLQCPECTAEVAVVAVEERLTSAFP